MKKPSSKHSPEVDAYIEKAAPFARPILAKIRALFHKASPQVQETMKWGFPHFEHKGIVGSMAAFKSHAGFGFWKGSLLDDPARLFKGVGDTSMSQIKLTSIDDLPSENVLMPYFRQAVELNEKEVKVARPPAAKKPPVRPPRDFTDALKKNRKALGTFEGFSPSHKREYVEWITEARQEATRSRRIATAVEWLAEGKPRNWKYQKGRG